MVREDRAAATREIIVVGSKSYEGHKMGSHSSEGLDGLAATSEMSRAWLRPADREASGSMRPGSQAGFLAEVTVPKTWVGDTLDFLRCTGRPVGLAYGNEQRRTAKS